MSIRKKIGLWIAGKKKSGGFTSESATKAVNKRWNNERNEESVKEVPSNTNVFHTKEISNLANTIKDIDTLREALAPKSEEFDISTLLQIMSTFGQQGQQGVVQNNNQGVQPPMGITWDFVKKEIKNRGISQEQAHEIVDNLFNE